METGQYVAELNEYALITHSELHFEDLGFVGPDHDKIFTQRVVLNDKVYPEGDGKNKKEAKHNAAKNALKCLLENEPQDSVETSADENNCTSGQPKEELNVDVSDICYKFKSLKVNAQLYREKRKKRETNYIGIVNHYCQKTKRSHSYIEERTCGPTHNTRFFYKLIIDKKEYPEGEGRTVKEARQNAARLAWSALQEQTDWDSKVSIRSTVSEDGAQSMLSMPSATPESHESSTQSTSVITFTDSSTPSQAQVCSLIIVKILELEQALFYKDVLITDYSKTTQFTIRAVLGGKAYPDGVGKNKKEAKQNAAKNALRVLFGEPDDSPGEEKQSGASSQPEEELDPKVSDICDKIRSVSVRTKDEGLTETNFIGIVNSYCQKTKKSSDYILVKKCGPPHNPQYFYKVVINCPVGEGKSVKEAKQNAARLAWSALQEQSDLDSKVAVKDKSIGSSQNETSTQSRFTSDFDPMECLGSGVFGCVFKARHKLLNKFYAVKIICCEEKALQEVETLSDLHHRNIIRYYTFWMEDSGYQWDISDGSSAYTVSSFKPPDKSSSKYLYIQMELCDTKTLRVWIDEKNAPSLQDSKRREESLRIAQQIVSGVEYIHSMKHIHRDLKPTNILFGLNGEVKIGDFGLVTRDYGSDDDDDDDDSAVKERTGCKGTPSYMAPEQRSEKPYDRKVDIFALGLIYFELLWKLSTLHARAEVWMNVRSQKLPEEFSLTFPEEDQIIKPMLCEKPEDRPDASQLKTELEKWALTFNSQNVRQENATY
ncbi:interferon-induced, double-stranded RNA-activated protein kinase-like [Epinephelus moara]|uniref:interferon-induced, double-stranded RNA-activated protein kinase-like n=1 Tax=Epinephelus moara TaxID=300413 RepID=UPI00214E2E97|nr:interferon-induced, double-stranded RNA-activated protein kinase-like [Epinephelus moara]